MRSKHGNTPKENTHDEEIEKRMQALCVELDECRMRLVKVTEERDEIRETAAYVSQKNAELKIKVANLEGQIEAFKLCVCAGKGVSNT